MSHTIIERLEQEKVVSFELSKCLTAVTVEECYDRWYAADLTKFELQQLISELQELEKQMI